MARNGYKITVYLDDNPNSPTYMETYEERTEDSGKCPISEDDLVLISNECEVGISGYTGYRLLQYYNRTTHEYIYVRELDAECEESSTEEQWVNSGSPYCETTEQGLNTGYMLQLQVQKNINLPNYGETRYQRYKSPECGGNNCPSWELVSKQCHISVNSCIATFDGTADIVEIDVNPLSTTYNQTRTVNKEDSDCENCTSSSFNWELVGDMCGDDSLLCDNGIQETSTNSYTVSRKYKQIGTGTPVPMDEYQVVLKTEDDEDCGYIRPQYEMRRMVGEYLCDFETYTKYEKLCQYVSYDSGVTWSLVVPEVCERGDVIAYDSYDCGKPMYRWIPNGEFTCEDNGDDGKIVYWDSNSVMVSAYTCDDTNYVNVTHVSAMTSVSSGATSPDGYKDCYQIGDCVSVIDSLGLNAKIWLGNYTESINNGLQNYERKSLDIPSKVNYIGNVFNSNTSHWIPYLRTMVLHPMTPPTLRGNTSMPIPMRMPQSYKDAGIFVPYEAYDDYLEAWSAYSAIIKPMNNDTSSYKAIIGYESDFTSWRCYVPDGESASTIGQNEWMYGRPSITSITLTNKIITVADDAFYNIDSYSGMYNLKVLNLGSTVETIGARAFKAGSSTVLNSYLDSVTLPSSLRLVKDKGLGLHTKDLYIDSSAEWQGQGIYSDRVHVTNLQKILNNSFETLDSSFFANSSTTLYIGDDVVTDLVIPSGTSEIGDYTFGKLNLNSVTIPSGVTASENVFQGRINDGYLESLVKLPNVSNIHVACGKLLDYNALYSGSSVTISEMDRCSDSPFKDITLYRVNNSGIYGDRDDYVGFYYSASGSTHGSVTYKVTGKTISLYYQTRYSSYSGSWSDIYVYYNGNMLVHWGRDAATEYNNRVFYSNTFDELSDGENTIEIDMYSRSNVRADIAIPMNTSSQTRTIATLYQDDGTSVAITRASNLEQTTLNQVDIAPYSSTTTSITVYDCSAVYNINYNGMEQLETLTFSTATPPAMNNYQPSASTKPYSVIVPCEYYPLYMDSYSGTPFANRIETDNDDCITSVEWIAESSYCDTTSGKMKINERKYVTYGDNVYKTDETRITYGIDCIRITNNNGFTSSANNEWDGHDYSRMDFNYLVDGGFTVTIYQDYSPSVGIYGYIDIYDENNTKIASSYRNNGATVELESHKTYTVKNVAERNGGSGKIKFNI